MGYPHLRCAVGVQDSSAARTSCASLRCTATLGDMRWWRRSVHRLAMMGRLSLLLVGILSTPGLELTSFQRPHCAGHEVSTSHAVHPAGHAGHHGTAPSWNRPSHADCNHCPPSECASLAPCAMSAISIAVPSFISLQSLSAHRVAAVRTRISLHSTTQRPPTPPPQFIA
jgi:hypothetical protein